MIECKARLNMHSVLSQLKELGEKKQRPTTSNSAKLITLKTAVYVLLFSSRNK